MKGFSHSGRWWNTNFLEKVCKTCTINLHHFSLLVSVKCFEKIVELKKKKVGWVDMIEQELEHRILVVEPDSKKKKWLAFCFNMSSVIWSSRWKWKNLKKKIIQQKEKRMLVGWIEADSPFTHREDRHHHYKMPSRSDYHWLSCFSVVPNPSCSPSVQMVISSCTEDGRKYEEGLCSIGL